VSTELQVELHELQVEGELHELQVEAGRVADRWIRVLRAPSRQHIEQCRDEIGRALERALEP
jgi:hypothetical protein